MDNREIILPHWITVVVVTVMVRGMVNINVDYTDTMATAIWTEAAYTNLSGVWSAVVHTQEGSSLSILSTVALVISVIVIISPTSLKGGFS